MKFAHSLALLLIASLTIPSALANFRIIGGGDGNESMHACPVNHYDCACMRDGDRAGQVSINDQGLSRLPDDFFQVKAGFCGMGLLNFYKRSDGHWDFYVSNGDGTLQGKCYTPTGPVTTTECSVSGSQYEFYVFRNELLCWGFICNN